MRPELDFTIEAENMDDFRDRVADFDTLAIPEVLFATPRVLVQSLAPGSRSATSTETSSPRSSARRSARDLLAFMFWGYFVDRMFHADPHPGNVFISPGEPGQHHRLGHGRQDRQRMSLCCPSCSTWRRNDGDGLARAWIEMGRATLRADIAGFIERHGPLRPDAWPAPPWKLSTSACSSPPS